MVYTINFPINLTKYPGTLTGGSRTSHYLGESLFSSIHTINCKVAIYQYITVKKIINESLSNTWKYKIPKMVVHCMDVLIPDILQTIALAGFLYGVLSEEHHKSELEFDYHRKQITLQINI